VTSKDIAGANTIGQRHIYVLSVGKVLGINETALFATKESMYVEAVYE